MKKKMKHEETKEEGHLDPHHKRRGSHMMHDHVPKGHDKARKSIKEHLSNVKTRNLEKNTEEKKYSQGKFHKDLMREQNIKKIVKNRLGKK